MLKAPSVVAHVQVPWRLHVESVTGTGTTVRALVELIWLVGRVAQGWRSIANNRLCVLCSSWEGWYELRLEHGAVPAFAFKCSTTSLVVVSAGDESTVQVLPRYSYSTDLKLPYAPTC